MQTPIAHRHADGSAHFSYCCPEDLDPYPRFAWQRRRPAGSRGPRSRTALGLFGAAFAVATAAFWATMLISPPVSVATAVAEPARRCALMEQTVRPWVDREAARRARVRVLADQATFNELLLRYQSAHGQCLSGKIREAESTLRHLEAIIIARADKLVLRDDD